MPITGLEDDLQRIAVEVLHDAADALMDDLIADAPFDTGELQESAFGPDVDEDALSATLGFTAPQADYTDLGVQPHGIDAVNAPVLAFFWENGPDGPGMYYYQHVNHPGQEATGWFSDKIDDWQSYVDEAAENV